LRDARLVTAPGEADGYSGNTLEFSTKDGNLITYTFDPDSHVLTRVTTSGSFPLTSDVSPGGVWVMCDSDCFTVTGPDPQVVKIDMKFRQAQDGAGVSYSGEAKIESSIVIRSTY